jgi:VNT family MFS transporter (synaptic vesicle glycoprotein 2)
MLRYYGLSIWFPEYIKKLEQEAYFRQTNWTENTTIRDTTFTTLLDNDCFHNSTFINVTFRNIELRHVTFDGCVLRDCVFANVTSRKTYFVNSVLSRVTFNHTDFHAYKFRGTQFNETYFENEYAGCSVDFDISYSSSQVFLENFLSQLVVIPATLSSALLMDRFGRVSLLGEYSGLSWLANSRALH